MHLPNIHFFFPFIFFIHFKQPTNHLTFLSFFYSFSFLYHFFLLLFLFIFRSKHSISVLYETTLTYKASKQYFDTETFASSFHFISSSFPSCAISYPLITLNKFSSSNPSMSSFTNSSSEIQQESESIIISTDPKNKSFGVYLSFCNQDATSFVLHLYTALTSETGAAVFFNSHKRFESGDEVITLSESALNVIGDCKIALIVFSTNYAKSRLCLQELEKITECCRTNPGLMVLPVFYDGVHLSSGTWMNGMFGEDFHDFLGRVSMKLETSKVEDKFMSWVAAISKVPVFPGHLVDNLW